MHASPSCPLCNGRGGTRIGARWIKCECVTGTTQTRRLVSAANGVGARNPAGDAVRKAMDSRAYHD